ncbi:MAG TPA: methylmalonyl-CoA mutase family protein [Patescibacteria group bacterium]|nr:methylmalonyl-CoA mutase family protein [Patescibacteria group bacterium]
MTDPEIKRLQGLLAAWVAGTLRESLARMPERRPEFHSDSGIPIARVYTPGDLEGFDYATALGLPGQAPFTRGVQPTMYRSRFWTMRQYSGFGDARETNRRLRFLLDRGQTGMSIAFDLPTQMGFDSDHAMAQGEVGRVGVAIDSLDDMETLLADLPLDRVSTSMTINATAAILLALYAAVAKKRGIPLDRLSGTVQNDVLKEYIARGTYIYPPQASLRIATDIFAFCRERMPRWNAISVSGYHIREAGSTAAQEIAFTFANGIAYLEAARAAGQPLDAIAEQISFFFNAHNHFLEEVAKFRAARRLWARIMKERFKVTRERALAMRFHAQTGGSTLTAQQPENNVARVALQALAAVLGGAQSLHTNGMDEALSLPTEKAATIALRTQQILAHESGIADTVDPLGGSYALESLTSALEAKASEYLAAIDRLGGTVAAIESGYQQREIQDAAYRTQQEMERGERVVVGVNRFAEEPDGGPASSGPGPAAPSIPIQRLDPGLETAQRERVKALRTQRDANAAAAALAGVEAAARGGANVMPAILHAVEARATLGEIADRMRAAFGAYQARDRI